MVDALLCANGWVQDEETAVLYPDEIHPLTGGLVQLRHVQKNCLCSWIGLTAEKQGRRQAALEIEEIQGNCVWIRGVSNQKETNKIGYGTGRYIISGGLRYLFDSLLQKDLLEDEGIEDEKLFSKLWREGVRGIILNKPIFDVGTPANLCFAISYYCEQEKI